MSDDLGSTLSSVIATSQLRQLGMTVLTAEEMERWRELKAAAEDVIQNWESGDLAGAVNWLSLAIQYVDGNRCSICGVTEDEHIDAKCRKEYEDNTP